MEENKLFNEDCKETMKRMEESSIPFIITDPPYLLEFMGKEFDSQHHLKEGANIGQKMQAWHTEWLVEAFRVLQPGGFLVAFGGTRTYHRLASAMEDVGFEIRDTLQWIYGSGFPKSLDISKAIDKRVGAEREVVGSKLTNVGMKGNNFKQKSESGNVDITKPESDEAKKWEGWGTALKPAYEPIVVGMKPMSKSFVDNALNGGVAGINIDGSRIATNPQVDDMLRKVARNERQSKQWRDNSGFKNEHNELTGVREDGRFPANVILQHHEECKKIGTKKVKGSSPVPNPKFNSEKPGVAYEFKTGVGRNGTQSIGFADENGMETIEEWECHEDCPVRIMNEQSGNRKTTWISDKHQNNRNGDFLGSMNHPGNQGYNDEGGAARFFYTAKASKGERNLGLEGMEKRVVSGESEDWNRMGINTPEMREKRGVSTELPAYENFHPTVKPIDLMRYLVNMFSTPDGGMVYDPFTGSGSTLIACKILGRPYMGSEMDKDYFEIAKKRLEYDWETWWAKGKTDDFVKVKKDKINQFFE